MADRPILFSAPMVRALLGGRKTQDRRILTPHCEEPPAYVENGTIQARDERNRPYRWPRSHAVGDRLWVREALDMGLAAGFPICTCTYAADGAPVDLSPAPFWAGDQKRNIVPSIHMPRWASRITFIVEAVKVERLQDISGEDCAAEGIPPNTGAAMGVYREKRGENAEAERRWQAGMRQQFRDLWRSINGPGSWDENPWVTAITFRPVLQNIDQVPHG